MATVGTEVGVMGDVWAVVVAAGAGTRFGGAKQFESLQGRSVLARSVAAAGAFAAGVVVVVAADRRDDARHALAGVPGPAPVIVAGAATRSASVRAGLAVVPAGAEVIVVHDAARPLAPPELFAAVVAAVRAGADAVVPGVTVADTLRHVAGGTVDRGQVVAVQTPQAFRAAALRDAHRDGADASDDASLVEAAGGKVVIVPGDPANLKITRPVDLLVARALLAAEGRA